MPEILVNSLKKAKLEAKQLNGFNENYFVAGDAFPISSNALADRKNTICKKAGLKKIRIHDFRHSCASLLINSGANVTVVAKYLGHTKVEETLNTYSHMFESALTSVVDVINNIDKKQTSSSNEVIDTITNLCNKGVSINDILNLLKGLQTA